MTPLARAFACVLLLATGTAATRAATQVSIPSAPTAGQKQAIAVATRVLDDLDAARYDAVVKRFAPTMAKAVDADKLRAVWMSLPLQFGASKGRGTPRVDSADGATVVHIPLAYEHLALEASVASRADGLIVGFLVQPAPPPPAATRTDLPAREVAFGPANRSTVPGTLLMPNGKGPFPAVVLVHGSGPNDRNETAGGTRVFLDVAEGLADRGIASLRYDKRTKVHPLEFAKVYTIDDETVDDAVAAVAFLRAQPGIDAKRVFLVGHSQGAMMAPRIAQRAPGLAGLVLLAAPARHLEDIVHDQFNLLARLDGNVDAAETAQLAQIDVAIARVKSFGSDVAPDTKLLNDLPASYWRDLRDYDPVATAKSLTLPILLLQGDRDFQVTAPDWALWGTAFATSDRVKSVHYPALNHLFVAGTGPGTLAEYAVPGHVATQPIDDAAAWIKAH